MEIEVLKRGSGFLREETSMKVGERLRQLRAQARVSQYRLAKLSGISQSHISDIESGTKEPTTGTLSKICSALGISLADFFSDDSHMTADGGTEAVHRTDDPMADLPEEARRSLEEFKEYILKKYGKK